MRKNEKRLLVVFGIVLVLMGSFIFAQKLRNWQRTLDRRERDIELAQMEANALLQEAPEWQAKETWLEQSQPSTDNPLEANVELENAEQRAQKLGLIVSYKQLQEPEKTDFYEQVGFNMDVKGELPAVFRWIHSMMAPSEFRVIPLLKITPDKENPAKVTAKVQFWRWYTPKVASGN